MLDSTLSAQELAALVERVFAPRATDRSLAILVDLPDERSPDNPDWKARRRLAASWAEALAGPNAPAGLGVGLWLYRNAHTNNGDLPSGAVRFDGGDLPSRWEEIAERPQSSFDEILGAGALALAPTEFSATAPLKVAARRLGFRAATMPGFAPSMVPALRLDYGEVNRRVARLKSLLDRAEAAHLRFDVDDHQLHHLTLDLRHRTAHASGGLLHESGTAGNLPSGEAYIVPYEGELPQDGSRSEGTLPVELEGEVVTYRIEANRAVAAEGEGPVSAREAATLVREPAYGNIAELGLGVLADFGVEPVGEVLLDEKLGLHIAFGRSEHFGGQVGPAQFSSPDAVVHIDRVYLPQLQPRIKVPRVDLILSDGERLALMRDGRYVIAWDESPG